jgi:hypothetical protein
MLADFPSHASVMSHLKIKMSLASELSYRHVSIDELEHALYLNIFRYKSQRTRPKTTKKY